MTNSPEPALDLSELMDLYKDDARRMVGEMRTAASHWEEICAGGPALKELRILAHRLRGSGRTYGFYSATRTSKALEKIAQQLEAHALRADDRTHRAVEAKIARLESIFQEKEQGT